MTSPVLIGIDLGTTVLKAAAFDAHTGKLMAHAARRLPVRAMPDGGREQDLRAVDAAFASVVHGLRAELGDGWHRIVGIGLAAQGGSTIIADRATGNALTPMILWNDARGHAYADAIARKTPRRFWRRIALRDFPPSGLGRLLWLKETSPDLFAGANIHVGAGEYLFFKLTGVWRQDAGNAIQIGPYDATKKRLDSRPFDRIGLPLTFVAPLRQGHETATLSKAAARSLGLSEGIPVAGPYIDQEAGYLACAGVSKHPLQCSLGTAWVGNFVLPDDTTGSSPFQLVLPAPAGQGRLVVQPLLAGNVAWEWALHTFVDRNAEKALSKAASIFAESLLAPDGLIALPWLTQPNPFVSGTHGSGAFHGIGPQTARPDLVRAVAAGMVFELARVFDAVRGEVDCVVLSGGASKGAWFRDLIAALFAPLPVVGQSDEDLSTARGAIHAFSAKAARVRTCRIPIPPKAVQERARRQFGSYCETFGHVFQRVDASAPFRFAIGIASACRKGGPSGRKQQSPTG